MREIEYFFLATSSVFDDIYIFWMAFSMVEGVVTVRKKTSEYFKNEFCYIKSNDLPGVGLDSCDLTMFIPAMNTGEKIQH